MRRLVREVRSQPIDLKALSWGIIRKSTCILAKITIWKSQAHSLLGGRVQPLRIMGYHPELSPALWPGIWNPEWDRRFEELYGYNPTKARALLEQAGYPHGFEFTVYLYTLPGLPEQVDIGQALALDWQAIGLKPQLVEIDFPRVRELFRTKTIHGAAFPTRHGLNSLETIRILNKAKDSVVYSYTYCMSRRNLFSS